MSKPRVGLAAESGQTIALYAITMLALALITFFTISVGVRVREKIKVQASADAAAYSMAVSEARALNLMAWANRAIVAEYVSALSVVGHESYLNYWEGTLKAQQQQMLQPAGEYGLQCPPCLTGCACCCLACKSAAEAVSISNMWKGKWQQVHNIWHVNGQPLHIGLHVNDAAYVAGAVINYVAGLAAYARYQKLAAGTPSLAEVAGNATDTRIHAIGPGRSTGIVPKSPATMINFTNAVQVDPAAEDWDSYHEILSGTRTGWILRHSQFVPGIPWVTGEAQQLEMAASCGGTAISPPPTNLGGAMMSKYSDKGDIEDVNTLNDHHYDSGAAKGEGGRYALTAVNKGGTKVVMICQACEPITYGSETLSYQQDMRMEGPKGCHNDSFVTAYDGYSDGDSNSGMSQIWPMANGIAQLPHGCSDDGVTAGGFFRFLISPGGGSDDTNESATKAQKDLWNQPYSYAALQLDLGTARQFPWDFNFGQIGGSLLTVQAGQNPTGGANTADHSLAGEGFDNLVWPQLGGFSTALTYYHNPDHWAEVPNLWNPFWRAKLEDPTNSQGATGSSKDPARNVMLDFMPMSDDYRVAADMGYQ